MVPATEVLCFTGVLLFLLVPQFCKLTSEQAYVVLRLLVDLRLVYVVFYLLDLLRYPHV